MGIQGHVENGVIVLDQDIQLPEGLKVSVSIVEPERASEQRYYVSPEQREAALSLLGILKTDQPAPTDEEVDQIRYEELMKKHG